MISTSMLVITVFPELADSRYRRTGRELVAARVSASEWVWFRSLQEKNCQQLRQSLWRNVLGKVKASRKALKLCNMRQVLCSSSRQHTCNAERGIHPVSTLFVVIDPCCRIILVHLVFPRRSVLFESLVEWLTPRHVSQYCLNLDFPAVRI